MGRRLLAAGLSVALLAACASSPLGGGVARELWVNASASATGDGSRDSPYQTLHQALVEGAARVNLAPGTYSAPARLVDGTELRGGPGVVLESQPGAPGVEVLGRVLLRGLEVSGGLTGLLVRGEVRLEDVALSGQAQTALLVESGRLTCERCVLRAGDRSPGQGLRVGPTGQAVLSGARVEGAFARAVEVKGGALTLRDVEIRGAGMGLHQEGGRATLERAHIEGGGGPALFVGAAGMLSLAHVRTVGHEYGVLTGGGARLEARSCELVGAARAGVAVVASEAVLQHLMVADTGPMGGVQAVNATVQLDAVLVQRASTGLSAVRSRIAVVNSTFTDLHETGLELRRTVAELRDVRVARAGGSCVLAAEASVVVARGLALQSCRTAGLLAETLADVWVVSADVRRSGYALAVPGEAQVHAANVRVSALESAPAWVDCSAGARAHFAPPPLGTGRCIFRWAPVRLPAVPSRLP